MWHATGEEFQTQTNNQFGMNLDSTPILSNMTTGQR